LKLLVIAAGGAVGTVLRYLVSGFAQRLGGVTFPWGTLVVNLTGCYVIGFVWELFDRSAVSPNTRLMVLVGVLGGYTTFSSFGIETFNMLRDGEYKMAVYNVLASNILGIALVFLGFVSSRYLMVFFSRELP
jgi:CrcB protein